LRQPSKYFYAAGFDALVKRWDKWRLCWEINVFSVFEYHKLYVLYPFVAYLLTLPRTYVWRYWTTEAKYWHFEFFSLQLAEYLMFFNDGNIKMVLLKTIPSHGKTRGEDIFQSCYASLLNRMFPLGSITRDGAPAMTSENVIGLCLRARSQTLFAATASLISKLYV
jgi:hypothetical protein